MFLNLSISSFEEQNQKSVSESQETNENTVKQIRNYPYICQINEYISNVNPL